VWRFDKLLMSKLLYKWGNSGLGDTYLVSVGTWYFCMYEVDIH